MFLLSRVLDYDLEKQLLRAEYDVSNDCIFFDDAFGGVPAWVSFEFMAQSISALSGLTRKAAGNDPGLGVILKVSNMEILQPAIKIKALIEVECISQFDSIFMFACSTYSNDSLCATADLMVMSIDDVKILDRKSEV
jgi:predicted hotdog family 3-hydroxylacyl-ACP dehydratase